MRSLVSLRLSHLAIGDVIRWNAKYDVAIEVLFSVYAPLPEGGSHGQSSAVTEIGIPRARVSLAPSRSLGRSTRALRRTPTQHLQSRRFLPCCTKCVFGLLQQIRARL